MIYIFFYRFTLSFLFRWQIIRTTNEYFK